MEINQPIQRLECQMCYFYCFANERLIDHLIKNHKFDPNFSVNCMYEGCGITLHNWRSFKKHLYRNHHQHQCFDNEMEIDDEVEELRGGDHLNLIQVEIDGEINLINIEENDNPDNRQNEANIDNMLKVLQWQAAKFCIDIREDCKISETGMKKITDGITPLFQNYLSLLLKKCQQGYPNAISYEEIKRIISDEFNPRLLLENIESKKLLNQFLEEEMSMVRAIKIKLSTNYEWRKRKRNGRIISDLVPVDHNAFVVPFLTNLKNLLLNDQVRYDIENPIIPHEDQLKTILDGKYYKNLNHFFANNQNSLAIILYFDELVLTSVLSTSNKAQKHSMFYWTLANIRPELRSSSNAIQLYAIVKSSYLKESNNNLQKMLTPLINDINTLQTEGVEININGEMKRYYGSLIMFVGDTPASALIGGFKESVAAHRPCRTCLITKEELNNQFKEHTNLLRTEAEHIEKLSDIDEPHLTNQSRNFWKLFYGINSRSPLMDIRYFEVTRCLPHDCMHVINEGVLELLCRLLIDYCISNGLFSIEELNIEIKNCDFKFFSKDKPAEFSEFNVEKNLKQTAAQIFVLAHFLPFLIIKYIRRCQEENILERYNLFILFLMIMNVTYSYEIHQESINLLRRMIEVFLIRFKDLFGDNWIPKIHFLVHICRFIELFGPTRQHCCFRFEAEHAYFKALVSVIHNFKNIAQTLADRFQSRLCARLFSQPGKSSKTFLYNGHKISPGKTISMGNSPFKRLFQNLNGQNILINDQTEVLCTSKIIHHGTRYEKNSIILLKCNNDEMPIFGKILKIYVLHHACNIYLVYKEQNTFGFDDNLNAYEIEDFPAGEDDDDDQRHYRIINLTKLLHPHPILSVKLNKKQYVCLINYERCEFVG